MTMLNLMKLKKYINCSHVISAYKFSQVTIVSCADEIYPTFNSVCIEDHVPIKHPLSISSSRSFRPFDVE